MMLTKMSSVWYNIKIMRYIILFILSLVAIDTYAFPKAIDIKELYVEGMWNTYSSFVINNDGSGDTAQKLVNLGMEIDFFRYFFINPRIVSMTDNSQFRLVGLEYKAGVHLGKYIDVFYGHLSHHVLDMTSERRFNQYDCIGVRVNLIPRNNK